MTESTSVPGEQHPETCQCRGTGRFMRSGKEYWCKATSVPHEAQQGELLDRAGELIGMLRSFVLSGESMDEDAELEISAWFKAAREFIQHAPRKQECFQSRVFDWMKRCFVRPDGLAQDQRAFRFIEEAIELVQASGTTHEDVLRLVDYVYSRPHGAVPQEIGGTMVTLAGLATSWGVTLDAAAEHELQRCESKTERIRAKDLAKPQRSPLPGDSSSVYLQKMDGQWYHDKCPTPPSSSLVPQKEKS